MEFRDGMTVRREVDAPADTIGSSAARAAVKRVQDRLRAEAEKAGYRLERVRVRQDHSIGQCVLVARVAKRAAAKQEPKAE